MSDVVDEVAGEDRSRSPRRDGIAIVVRSRLGASIVLVLILFALSFALDERGFLGTDTGGKVATLDQMIERGDWRSDVGYWAADLDPEGDLHPLYNTSPVGDQWINATSLPMLLAARPFYDVGGYRLALLWPIIGTVLAAGAAWAIAEKVRTGRGPAAFWLVGLAGPLTIYALDLWEHSIGAALIGWAVVLSMELRERPPARLGAELGLLVGVAATMRTESFVYGAVIVGGSALILLEKQRKILPPLVLGLSASAALGLTMVVNAALESALMGGSYRSGRAAGTASAVGSDLGLRLKEAVVTGAGLFPSLEPRYLFLALVLAAALVAVAWRRQADRTTTLLVALVAVLYVMRLLDGFGFVPGLLAAAPLTAVALAHGRTDREARTPLLLALVALPLVWLTQYTGGAAPQWAGRYILPSMLVLTSLGVALLEEVVPVARRALVALSVGVTLFGLVWTAQRTHGVANHGEQLVAVAGDDALISDSAFWLRELAAFYDPERPWLTAQGESLRTLAVSILEDTGHEQFGVLHLAVVDAPDIPGYAVVDEVTIDGFPGVDFEVSRYEPEQ